MYLLIYNQDTNILIGEEKMRKYKKPLKIEEQIQYLKDNKRVIFKNESEEESKEYLLINNYINVISPFKYEFFKKDKNGNPIKGKFN